MINEKSYRGIDYFRIIAAILIITIHTSPLSDVSSVGDFILTRILARVAVPFFMMTSGFFLLSRYHYDNSKLKAFVKKTLIIYGISILIYIPINVYNGYFVMDSLLPNIIKDLIFDGTMYHLWYLPASVIGVVIAWFCVRKSGFGKAVIFTLCLFFLGLLGDSYYGITEKFPLLKSLYQGIFEISDYTRNGVFYAPVFFVLGGVIADKSVRLTLKKSVIGFAVSFAGMFAEGLLLHHFDMQRHDSMYIMLLPCMFFLFYALTFWKRKRSVFCRTSALIIYIIHPIMIVAVRMFAKLTHTQSILVDNSIIHFFVVALLSSTSAVLATLIITKINIKNSRHSETDRAWLEINLDNLKHNVKELQNAMPEGCEVMAVLKADGYGHSAYEVSTCVNNNGVRAFAVATIDEGIQLRYYGIRGEILILGYTDPLRAKELYKYDLIQTLVDYDYALLLDKQKYKLKAHIKIDTGMHRLGFDCTGASSISEMFSLSNIKITGLYTHLCVSGSLAADDVDFTKLQISRFYNAVHNLKEQGLEIPKIHMQSSTGFLNYSELKCDYIRPGIALYGVKSSPNEPAKLNMNLLPVLSLKARIIHIRTVHIGESIGYGRTFVAQRESKIGILPIGYADGVPRNLSCGKGEVLIHGQRVPIVGRICMDQLTIDITDITDVFVGDVVTLIGRDGNDELLAADVADHADSISNELLSRMGRRLIIVKNKD